MARWLVAAVLVASGGTAGYILGRPEPLRPETIAEPAGENAAPSGNVSPATIDSVPANAHSEALAPSATAAQDADAVSPSTVQGIIDRFDNILAIDDYHVRRYHNEVLFDNMTAEQAPEVFEALSKLPQRAKEAQLMLFFFAGWGRVDGPAAVQASLGVESRGRVGLTSAALTAWSWSDPHAAWESARQLAHGWPALGSRINEVVTELAKEDLPQAIALRNDVDNRQATGSVQRAVIEFAIQEGRVDAVVDEIARFESIEEQKSWLSSLFSSWGRIEDDAPLAALATVSDPVLAESAMTGFLNGWTGTDPEGALDYLLAHPDNPAAKQALPNALRQVLYYGDRATTLDVIERVAATGDIDTLAPPMLSSLASAQPEIALKLAGMLSSDQQRERYSSLAVSVWARNDYESATAYYEQLPQSPAKLQAFRELAYQALSREDGGERIARWIDGLSTGKDRTQAVESLLISATSSTQLNPTAGSRRTLQQLARQTPNLSERAQDAAGKLFGDDSAEGAQP